MHLSHTLVYVHGFRMLLKFRAFSQKYEIYEIKSGSEISAITVLGRMAFWQNRSST